MRMKIRGWVLVAMAATLVTSVGCQIAGKKVFDNRAKVMKGLGLVDDVAIGVGGGIAAQELLEEKKKSQQGQ